MPCFYDKELPRNPRHRRSTNLADAQSGEEILEHVRSEEQQGIGYAVGNTGFFLCTLFIFSRKEGFVFFSGFLNLRWKKLVWRQACWGLAWGFFCRKECVGYPISCSRLANFAGFVVPEGENCFQNWNFGRRNLRLDRCGVYLPAVEPEWPSFWFGSLNLTGGGWSIVF